MPVENRKRLMAGVYFPAFSLAGPVPSTTARLAATTINRRFD
jgi:hypothetical protein